MGKAKEIELGRAPHSMFIPILFEDRSILAIDKPVGWIVAPEDWGTGRNLHRALMDGIQDRSYWALSRNIKFLRFVHRLDGETTGVLLLAKTPGAIAAYSKMFETRAITKRYLAIVHGHPKQEKWSCALALADTDKFRVKTAKNGKEAQTDFRVLERGSVQGQPASLVEAEPHTGRKHQIRVHLQSAGHPIFGDVMYGSAAKTVPLALRASEVSYREPFSGKPVTIRADKTKFLEIFSRTVESVQKQESTPERASKAPNASARLNAGSRSKPAHHS